jgi:hypothetical protein
MVLRRSYWQSEESSAGLEQPLARDGAQGACQGRFGAFQAERTRTREGDGVMVGLGVSPHHILG